MLCIITLQHHCTILYSSRFIYHTYSGSLYATFLSYIIITDREYHKQYLQHMTVQTFPDHIENTIQIIDIFSIYMELLNNLYHVMYHFFIPSLQKFYAGPLSPSKYSQKIVVIYIFRFKIQRVQKTQFSLGQFHRYRCYISEMFLMCRCVQNVQLLRLTLYFNVSEQQRLSSLRIRKIKDALATYQATPYRNNFLIHVTSNVTWITKL